MDSGMPLSNEVAGEAAAAAGVTAGGAADALGCAEAAVAGLVMGVLAMAVESTDDIEWLLLCQHVFSFPRVLTMGDKMWAFWEALVGEWKRRGSGWGDEDEDHAHPKNDLWLGEWS